MAALYRAGIRQRQRLAVKLAVRGQRHPLQQHQVRGHHIVRQAGLQVRLELRVQCLPGLPGARVTEHQVGGQLLAGRPIEIDDTAFADRGMFLQAGFDFAQLDAEATDLHLVVETADVLYHPLLAITGQVTRAVQAPPSLLVERIRDKTFSRQSRTLMVAAGQAVAADQQLATRAQWQSVEVLPKNMQLGIGDRPPQPDIVAGRQVMGGGPDRRLGRAIDVPDMPGLLDQPLRQFRTQRLATTEDLAPSQEAGRGLVEQHAPGRWRRLDQGDRVMLDQLDQRLRILVATVVEQHHRGAAHQRQIQLQAGDIE